LFSAIGFFREWWRVNARRKRVRHCIASGDRFMHNFPIMNALASANVLSSARMASGMTSRARRPQPFYLAG
jgi:hypothetical protein